MLIELSKLKGLPVGVLEESRKAGTVSKVIFDHSQAKIIGFLIKTNSFWGLQKVVSLSDVIVIDESGLVINSSEDILEKDEVVRVGALLKKNAKLVGLRVCNKEERFLGFLNDAVIETQTGNLVRIYAGFLWRKFIFSQKQIIKLDEKRIVVDTESKVKDTAKAVARAVEPAQTW